MDSDALAGLGLHHVVDEVRAITQQRVTPQRACGVAEPVEHMDAPEGDDRTRIFVEKR